MKAKKYLTYVVIIASVLVIVLMVAKGDTPIKSSAGTTESPIVIEMGVGTLVGLDGVGVNIDLDSKQVAGGALETDKYGLTEQILRTDVELQLRQYGIKVLTEMEAAKSPGSPMLYIGVSLLIAKEAGVSAVMIIVELCQSVCLLREPPRFVLFVPTWQKQSILLMGLVDLRSNGVKKNLKNIVNMFINDYLAANPKETEAKSKNDK